jgi:hypothetical protein
MFSLGGVNAQVPPTPSPLPRTPQHAPFASPGAETFPSPSTVADSEVDLDINANQHRNLTSPPARNRGEPQAGRHSPT